MRSFSALLCEGPEDLAAIRGLLKDRRATRKAEASPRVFRPGATPPEHWSDGQATLLVQSVGGKDKLPQAVLDVAQGGATERPGRVIVSFDPDADSPTREFEFVLSFIRHAGQSSTPERAGDDWKIRVRDRDVLLTPAPWRADASFDHLPDHQCLERVLISALAAGSQDIKPWIEEATTALMRRVQGDGWKRAFRLWSAALDPRESFVDRLLQDDTTRLACLSALRATPVSAALGLVLG